MVAPDAVIELTVTLLRTGEGEGLLTVTVTLDDPVFPTSSIAIAVRVCWPLVADVVFQPIA